MLLDQQPDLDVVGTAVTPSDAMKLCEDARPDVLIVEADSDEWAARRLAAAVRRQQPRVRVVGLSAPGESEDPIAAMRAGFTHLVPRHRGAEGVVRAVRSAPAAPQARTWSTIDLRTDARPVLTPREVSVLKLIGMGMTTRDMAAELEISPKTVENHKQRMFAKLGVQNQAHAVAVAMRKGLIPSEAGFQRVASGS
ncbi:MAG TPA: response regulator transcription factor [Acidimicrobiales bacterium]|nr:response regulator transcription factor [Acidimicrobiales bacterium]